MAERICPWCGENPARRMFCSDRCKDAAKYERYKRTGVEDEKRARRNAKYRAERASGKVPSAARRYQERARAAGVEPAGGYARDCAQCGEGFVGLLKQRFCGVTCRRRSARQRAKTRTGVMRVGVLLPGMRRGEPRRVACTVIDGGGLWAYCPDCGVTGQARYGREGPFERWCHSCDEVFAVDAEEATGAIAEACEAVA